MTRAVSQTASHSGLALLGAELLRRLFRNPLTTWPIIRNRLPDGRGSDTEGVLSRLARNCDIARA
jgi:hypothetical protein